MPNEHVTPDAIQDLLDGRLAESEAYALRAHARTCGRCAAEMSALAGVFEALGELGALVPAEGFAERVMHVAVPATSLGTDVLELGHVTADALVDYLDAALAPAAHGVVERHLAGCGSCRELEAEWTAVFRELGSLSRFAPAENFRDRVMDALPARVAAAVPAPVAARESGIRGWVRGRARNLAARISNGGRGRWAVLAGVGTAPAAVAASVAWVVFSHPLVTVAGLGRFALLQASQLVSGFGGVLLGGVVESAATYQLWVAIQSLASTPLVALLGIAALCAVLSSSVWVLFRTLGPIYRNLLPIRVMSGPYARANV